MRRRFERTPYYDAAEWARLVSIAPERRRWLSAEKICNSPFWMMIDRPNVATIW